MADPSDVSTYWRYRWPIYLLERVITVTWCIGAWHLGYRWWQFWLPVLYWYCTNLYFLSRVPTRELPKVDWPIPKGWYKVADSFDVPVGRIVSAQLASHDLVVFRTNTGCATVTDAYCPHLGAHLNAGGQIVGNCIECPFHGWRFQDTDGKCVHMPHSDKKCAVALRLWPSREANKQILVWYTPEPAGAPEWEPSVIDPWDLAQLCGKAEHLVSCRLQDIPENGADIQHLHVLHRPYLLGWAPCLSHGFSGQWKPSPERKHMSEMEVETWINVFGRCLDWTRFRVTIQQIGPGLVHLHFQPTCSPEPMRRSFSRQRR